MSATKILCGQILTVLAIVLSTTRIATQWTAWRLGFQPQFGATWVDLGTLPVYPPPAFWWWYFFDAYATRIFIEGAAIAASDGFSAIAVASPCRSGARAILRVLCVEEDKMLPPTSPRSFPIHAIRSPPACPLRVRSRA